ncbi:hypothetical protein [Brevundimonas sp.]|jgi:hypothetical protein|uniref:hypothetical protein n=1 Tax=Brevundimonas sp. TaxID=1871086 RepID=UPI003785064C
MSRDPKQIEAERRYAVKRPKKPVSFRLDDDEMAELDAARGAKSRAEFALEATIKAARAIRKRA